MAVMLVMLVVVLLAGPSPMVDVRRSANCE